MPKFFGPKRMTFGRFLKKTGRALVKSAGKSAGKFVLKTATRAISSRFRAAKFRTKRRKTTNPLIRQKPYVAAGGQGTFSKFSSVHRPTPQVKALKRVGASNVYIQNVSEQLLVQEGFQNINAKTIQSRNDLYAMYQTVAGNTTPTPAPSSTWTKRFLLESTHVEHIITNSSLATAYIDVYDIVCKREASTTQNADPVSAWSSGTIDASPAGTPNPANVINSVPTDSQTFRDFYKVVKRTHISLAQGATHKHSVYLKPNYIVDGELLQQTSTSTNLAGITMYTMIVAYGQPASGPTGGLVTTAKLAVDVVRAIRYKYTFIQNATDLLTYSDGLYSLTGEQIVSAGAGAIVTNNVA